MAPACALPQHGPQPLLGFWLEWGTQGMILWYGKALSWQRSLDLLWSRSGMGTARPSGVVLKFSHVWCCGSLHGTLPCAMQVALQTESPPSKRQGEEQQQHQHELAFLTRPVSGQVTQVWVPPARGTHHTAELCCCFAGKTQNYWEQKMRSNIFF